jgi:hypothetical protein
VKGETAGYVEDCKARLAELHVRVMWDIDKKVYVPMK